MPILKFQRRLGLCLHFTELKKESNSDIYLPCQTVFFDVPDEAMKPESA